MKKIEVIDKKTKSSSKFYSTKKVLATNSLYHILIGGRNAGKSYEVKRFALEEAYKKDKKTGFVFRTEKGRGTNAEAQKYFGDMRDAIRKITRGEYDDVIIKTRDIFFYKKEEDEQIEVQGKDGIWSTKIIKGERKYGPKIGSLFFLTEQTTNKSSMYPETHYLIMEEFLIKPETKEVYLQEEPTLLESLVSTVFRNIKGKVFLIGNKHTPVNPYTYEWGLDDLKRTKVDTITIYEMENSRGHKIQVAVDDILNKNTQNNAISRKGQQQESGDEWEHGDYMTVNDIDITKYRKAYTFIFSYMGVSFLCDFMTKGREMFILVTRKTSKIQPKTRVIGSYDSMSILHTKTFKPLNDRERIIFDLLNQEKIVYANNNTGSDFNAALMSFLKS